MHESNSPMEAPSGALSGDETKATMDGCAVLTGNHLENCTVNQTIINCPDRSWLTAGRDACSDHCADTRDAEDTTRDQQTYSTTLQGSEDTPSDEAPSLLTTSSSTPSSRQDSGVFSSLGSSFTHSGDHLINSQQYRTYHTCGMALCRTMAYQTHKVTLNKFGGVSFESVPSGAVEPIGNVTQMAVKLKTLHRKKTGHRWHELHMGGWAIILPSDADAEQWMFDLGNIPNALLDTKEYDARSITKGCKVQHDESSLSEASQVTTASKKCPFAALKMAPDVLLKYRLAEVVSGSWLECSRCFELSGSKVHDIQSWYTSCVERSYTVLDIFHEQCEKESKKFVTEAEKRMSCLPQFQELQSILKSTDHLCVKDLCPGVFKMQEVHEVPSAAVCQMISSDHGIASQWTKLARLLGLNRSQIDLIRLECHGRPQPCQLSADRVLTWWSTSGGTAHSCSLATLLRVLQYMDQGLVLSKVVEYLQASSAS